eukprot:TRINITY_DN16591_c0_g2_i1.p1 TRINITY_DN16591_c0_g2~~TRINITY_DN16591_c0_g2_i1.p1  ORF type:complete len:320 (+),score=9.24 TRINITY_DN16591_c0_g2_i1:273-1232(+)
MAIDNLFSYASMVDYFVAICPDGVHEDSHEPAGPAAYQSRVWCRVEQVAHCSVNGHRGMYFCDGLEHLEPIEERWVKRVIHIFEAETTCCRRRHPDESPCDRELLVPTLLAMYAVLLERMERTHCKGLDATVSRSLEAVWSSMNADIDRCFPRRFKYYRSDGTDEERILFGNAVSCLRELATAPVGMMPVTRMLRSSPLALRGLSFDQKRLSASLRQRLSKASVASQSCPSHLPPDTMLRALSLSSSTSYHCAYSETATSPGQESRALLRSEGSPAPCPIATSTSLAPLPPCLHQASQPEAALEATCLGALDTRLKRSI